MLFTLFLAACLAGTVMHFLYAPLGAPGFLAPFLPVSESPWEHYKLAFWPLCAALIFWGIKNGAETAAILCSCLAAVLSAAFVIFGIYYTYTAGFDLGPSVLWVDILSYYIAMYIAFCLGIRVMASAPAPVFGFVSAMGLILIALALAVFSFRPPRFPIFRSPKL